MRVEHLPNAGAVAPKAGVEAGAPPNTLPPKAGVDAGAPKAGVEAGAPKAGAEGAPNADCVQA